MKKKNTINSRTFLDTSIFTRSFSTRTNIIKFSCASHINILRHLSSRPLQSVSHKLGFDNIIKFYNNCDTEKENIFALSKELRDKGVVYCLQNNVNNKIYVGSSTNFTFRLYKYYSISYLYNNKTAINNALAKYGYSQFSLYIIDVCDKDKILEREQYFMDTLQPEYNILKIAGSSRGFKHSDKTLKWFKEERLVSEDTRQKLSRAASKRILTLDEKNKLSLSSMGKVMPLATRLKISDSSNVLRGVTINVHDAESHTSKQFPSLTAAAQDIKVSRTAIKKALIKGNAIKDR